MSVNKWADVNGDKYDAERIAKWFFQVDDPRQRECEELIKRALVEARAAIEGEPSSFLKKLEALANKWPTLAWRDTTISDERPTEEICAEELLTLLRAERVLEAAPRDTASGGILLQKHTCECAEPYEGARLAGTPRCCERCGGLIRAAAPLPTAREAQWASYEEWEASLPRCLPWDQCDGDLPGEPHADNCPMKDQPPITLKMAFEAGRAAQPISGLQRTAGDVIRQFRESGSEDWGELESAINWWAMNDFCPNFTKGDRAVPATPQAAITIYQRAPRCPRHGEWMNLSFYDRPGSPPGNGWVCRSCARERAALESA